MDNQYEVPPKYEEKRLRKPYTFSINIHNQPNNQQSNDSDAPGCLYMGILLLVVLNVVIIVIVVCFHNKKEL